MITFKKFMEAQIGDLASMDTPQTGQQPQQPQQRNGRQLKGTLTDNEKRVLALLASNQMKTAPSRARDVISGDRNMVQAVKGLKLNFKAVDVSPDGVTINQAGIELATKQGIIDPNTGSLTDIGTELATTTSKGIPNPKTKDLNGGDQPGQQSMGMGASPAMPGLPSM